MKRNKYTNLFLTISFIQLFIGIFIYHSGLILFLSLLALCLFEYLVLATLRYYQTNKKAYVAFLGSVAQGGIGTYMKDAQQHTPNISIYLYPTHKDGGLFYTLLTFTYSIICLSFTTLLCIMTSRPLILHLHMATKGSFIRKLLITMLFSPFCDATVLHLHGGETPQFFEYLIRRNFRWILSSYLASFTKIVTVSETLKSEVVATLRKYIIPFDETRITVIHNSTTVPRILPQPKQYAANETLELITVARADPEKNTLLLIPIAQQLKERKIKAHITHIGPGAQLEELKQLVTENKLEEYLTILGPIPHEQIDLYYRKAHITLLTSLAESFGIVVLEGYKNGNAAITSDVGGLKDIVEEGKTGYRCSATDAIEFAEKINTLANNPKLLVAMQENAQQKVLQYSHEHHATQLTSLYESL